MAFHLAQRNDTAYWRELKVAAQQYHTRERLIEGIFDPKRKRTPGPDHDCIYPQNVLVGHAIYNEIEILQDRCLLNIDLHEISPTITEFRAKFYP